MNKIERVDSALRGEETDRPPYCFWYHFGLQHCGGEKHAEAEIDFFRAYDLDFLKVMNDYPYPSPDGAEMLSSIDDWRKLRILKGDEEGFGEQLKALRLISKALNGKAYFVETIFSPWTMARKLSDSQTLIDLKRDHPDVLLDAMEKISESLANYARRAVEAGAAGIFLSLGAATKDLMDYDDYLKFCRPFDLKILEAVKSNSVFNILHIHGRNVFFEELIDYPVQAVNWSHATTAPTLIEARRAYRGCLLGGLDETQFSRATVSSIRRQIEDTAAALGCRGLVIAPGCSVPTDSARKLLAAVGQSVKAI